MQGQRLKRLVENKGITNTAFAEKVERSRSYVQDLFNYEEIPIKTMRAAAKALNVDFQELWDYLTAVTPHTVAEPKAEYGSYKKNIIFIPVAAHAGKLAGFGDARVNNYDEFERFYIPGFDDGTYHAFPVKGDSMGPLFNNGDIIICKPVEKLEYIKEKIPYAFLFDDKDDDGFVVKNWHKSKTQKDTLTFTSINDLYPPFEKPMKKIKAVWYIVDCIQRNPIGRYIKK